MLLLLVKMDENLGQQFALQVAVQTMKERCLQLQQRLSIVEEENMNLRVKNHLDGLELNHNVSKSEIEILHEKIAQLTKQKSQLTHNVLMVATENRHLWNRLSKLTQTNQTLGDNVTKVNEHLKESVQLTAPTTSTQTTLIRSKTFTHETPPKIVKKIDPEENNTYTDASLEDISLKIINSIAQEKYELEKQCAQMAEMQSNESVLTNSIGFAYPYDELEDNVVEEMTQNMENLIHIKNSLIEQQGKLKAGYDLLKRLMAEGGIPCKNCKEEKENKKVQEPQPLRNLTFNRADVDKKQSNVHHRSTNDESEKICPICNKLFINDHISELVKHVECHFIAEEHDFDMIDD